MTQTTAPHTCTTSGRPLPFGRLAPIGRCQRCDARRPAAAPQAVSAPESAPESAPQTEAAHNHPRRPFGAYEAAGECQRCDALREGRATAKTGWGGRSATLDAHNARVTEGARRAHFAPGGPHAMGQCGSVCTFGDW